MAASMRDKQREETRRRLYHAALEIFCRDGVANCRIEDIAQIAQVSRAAFYFHFPSKDDVLAELLKESETPVADAVEGLPETATLEQVFEALISTMANFWSEGQRGKLLIEIFGVVMRRTEVLSARSYNGQTRVRTQVTGWYLKRDRSVGVGTDGLFYVLSTPGGLRERLRGATLSPADPPLELGRGARDGESLPLVEALRKRLDAGSDWR